MLLAGSAMFSNPALPKSKSSEPVVAAAVVGERKVSNHPITVREIKKKKCDEFPTSIFSFVVFFFPSFLHLWSSSFASFSFLFPSSFCPSFPSLPVLFLSSLLSLLHSSLLFPSFLFRNAYCTFFFFLRPSYYQRCRTSRKHQAILTLLQLPPVPMV